MGEFRMPALGADMEAGTIVEWRVALGDTVHHGDIVAVIDTDKADIEVEVFEDGVVDALLVPPGVRVGIGTPLAHIAGSSAGAGPVGASPTAAAVVVAVPSSHAPSIRPSTGVPGAPAAPPGERGVVRASPQARRLAAAAGVDLGDLVGSGPGGAIVAADVPASPATPPTPVPAVGDQDRRATRRRAIGELMARSAREVPHYYLATTIDLGGALAWLASRNEQCPVAERLLPAALLLKATALAARRVPTMNGSWRDGFEPADAVHLGVAIALRGGGLVAPAILRADERTLPELMTSLRDLVGRARSGALRSSEMSAPTLTVTNLGDEGVDEVFGVISSPQVALVGFGQVADRPWVVDGAVVVRPLVRASLAADHRVSDGRDGARFLAAIDHLLHQPEEL